jgi:aryl-alcohol dehydrogenase-like predicted oxidoreductase
METRVLGTSGLQVGAIGLGCMAMTRGTYSGDLSEARATIRQAVEAGVTLFDTADVYGPFVNERLVGEALAPVLSGVTIATKFGNEVLDDGTVRLNGRPEYVQRAADASLKRLGVDAIDLYFQHRVDPQVPIEETVGAMRELVLAGKARYIGLCEVGEATIRRAHAVHPLAAIQTEYSLWSRDVERAILPALTELGIGFVAYSPLGRGFLTGRFRRQEDLDDSDWRRQNPRFRTSDLRQNLELVDAFGDVAERLGCSLAHLALAWTLSQSDYLVPIPGTTRIQNLQENIRALDVRLDGDTLEELDQLCRLHPVSGDRYDALGMDRVEG